MDIFSHKEYYWYNIYVLEVKIENVSSILEFKRDAIKLLGESQCPR